MTSNISVMMLAWDFFGILQISALQKGFGKKLGNRIKSRLNFHQYLDLGWVKRSKYCMVVFKKLRKTFNGLD